MTSALEFLFPGCETRPPARSRIARQESDFTIRTTYFEPGIYILGGVGGSLPPFLVQAKNWISPADATVFAIALRLVCCAGRAGGRDETPG